MLIDSGGKEISVYRYENTGFAVSKKRDECFHIAAYI